MPHTLARVYAIYIIKQENIMNRMEAVYAKEIKKSILPIIITEGWEPDGW